MIQFICTCYIADTSQPQKKKMWDSGLPNDFWLATKNPPNWVSWLQSPGSECRYPKAMHPPEGFHQEWLKVGKIANLQEGKMIPMKKLSKNWML